MKFNKKRVVRRSHLTTQSDENVKIRRKRDSCSLLFISLFCCDLLCLLHLVFCFSPVSSSREVDGLDSSFFIECVTILKDLTSLSVSASFPEFDGDGIIPTKPREVFVVMSTGLLGFKGNGWLDARYHTLHNI